MLSFARLKDLGIEPEFCLNHGVVTSLYYAGPDQNLVELQVDNFTFPVFTGGHEAARPSEFYQSQKGGLWIRRLMQPPVFRCAPRCSFQLR